MLPAKNMMNNLNALYDRHGPQLVSQSLKNKRLCIIREQTSSEALSTFTYAACAESIRQRSRCPVVVGDPGFNSDLLKHPDLKFDEANLLDS